MVSVPAGCFQMGSISGHVSEQPMHEACLKGFKMGKYKVTQGLWRAVLGNNPSYFSSCGDDWPVKHVGWNDIENFLQQFNRKTDLNFRLPSVAEVSATRSLRRVLVQY
jgi:formylglycine-generating enzyme required for sulfatase activity